MRNETLPDRKGPRANWNPGVTRRDRFAWAVVSVSFGFGQPILDLLGRSPAFFGARNAPALDVILAGVFVGVFMPLLAGLVALLPGRVGRTTFFLGSGIGLFAIGVQVPQVLGSRNDLVWVAAGLVSVVGGMWLFDNVAGVRAATRLLVIAPVLFVFLFLFTSPTGATLRAGSVDLPPALDVRERSPIVVVVLDEFPVASLLTPDGSIHREWFPNLSSLADDSIWFRNAATTQQQTDHAVPAILTGIDPSQDQLPVLADHPANLFTLLDGDYRIHAVEALTSLCPDTCDEIIDPAGAFVRWTALASDLSVASGHRLLPPAVAATLPSIEDAWADFGHIRFEDEIRSDRTEIVGAFSSAIEGADDSDEAADLFFLHVLLPHRPWQHLPDGRVIADADPDPPGFIKGTWLEEWPAHLATQRYLMEAQFTDRMIGSIVGSMKKADIYDDAIMVVIADHGVSIEVGTEFLRTIHEDNMGAIGAIPLFVKLPGQESGGEVSDYRALGIDVLPTIVDALGADVVSNVDGVSLLSADLPSRTETVTTGPSRTVAWPVSGDEKYGVAAQFVDLFPNGDILRLIRRGDEHHLGRRVSEPICEACVLDDADLFEDVDTSANVIPAVVKGHVDEGIASEHRLGIGVNGLIEAVTYTFIDEEGRVTFQAVIDPSTLRDGQNTVEIVDLG